MKNLKILHERWHDFLVSSHAGIPIGDNGPLMKASTYLSDTGVKKARLLPKDAILVTCIGTLGKVGIADQSLVTNQQINSLVFDTEVVFPKYAYFYCKTLRPILKSLAPSTTVAIFNHYGLKVHRMDSD